MMKNAFYFKRKIRLISKFMTSQPGKQYTYWAIAIHILPNISRSKNNQTMKFAQLIDITWEALLLKNHIKSVVEKLFSDIFLKNQNCAYLWINSLSFMQFLFILCQVEAYRNILKLSCRSLAFTSHKVFFKKTKRGLELVSLPHFLHDF